MSVEDLVSEGVLSPGFRRMRTEAFPIDRPLYRHQEQAIRRAVTGDRNLMIATGTGSGKTECFLLPIVDQLLRERDAGTLQKPGVRALLLYPMNALANDQLKRLRVLLQDLPDITFGRYVGDTKKTSKEALIDFETRNPHERHRTNELLSREEMQENPPSILLTNYAMLEYLLLRPEDSSLFDGPTGEHWRSIALDEIHVYAGAEGTEIGMLLRRLRDRVNQSTVGRLQCFGTSATLGRGVPDYPELCEFGEALFGEPFTYDASDAARQDVIGPTRRPLTRTFESQVDVQPSVYRALLDAYERDATPEEVSQLAGIPLSASCLDAATALEDIMGRDGRMRRLQASLEKGSVAVDAVSETVFRTTDDLPFLIELVALGVVARRAGDESSLLPARYHFFLRALEGAYVCLHPDHPESVDTLQLDRHEECPTCTDDGRDAVMFELGVCRRCGSEYVVGSLANGTLTHTSPLDDQPARLLLRSPLAAEDDEDESALDGIADRAVEARLCPACGTVAEGTTISCTCASAPPAIEVWIARADAKNVKTRRCIACARRAGRDPVSRFLTGSDAPVSVIATDLYQGLPESTDNDAAEGIGAGRKLLIFSDSRQDAAFFAPFLQRTYRRAVERGIIARAVRARSDEDPTAEDLIQAVVKEAEREQVIDIDDTSGTKRRTASTWLTRELLSMDRRQGLEGTGTAEIRLRLPRKYRTPQPLLQLGFTAQEADDLIRLLADTLRYSGAVTVLDDVDITDPAFAPRNRAITVQGQASDTGVLAWNPVRGLNGRLDLLQRIFDRRGIDADPAALLNDVWKYLTGPATPFREFESITANKKAPSWAWTPRAFSFRTGLPERAPQKCSRCQQLWWRSISDVCPGFKCDGVVSAVDDIDDLVDDHYARLYRDLKPIGMSVEEHTAQWTSEEASFIQEKFVRGELNVLSCSTTFELGVDVGDIQAVLLRNVPPSPANYIQRAGRAGRRTDSAALVVTFAQRRSHDLNFFARPAEMVDGTIPPPRVLLDNAPIVRRHMHSVAFAAFQRVVGAQRRVEDFFVQGDDGVKQVDAFVEWLRTFPAGVGEAVQRVVPRGLHSTLELENWGWVEALVDREAGDHSRGWLDRASREIADESTELERLEEEAGDAKNYKAADRFRKIRRTILSRQLLSYLAQRNVLPKYGFPVDVVELNLARTGDPLAARIQLSRDLKLAIRDYAPGAETVAGGARWRSTGLAVRQGLAWPEYEWATCATCGAFRQGLPEISPLCPSCQGANTERTGKFAIPLYGFVGRKVKGPVEVRPVRNASVESFFGSYKGAHPTEFESVQGLGESSEIERRFGRNGRITVVNSGPRRQGYYVCRSCGFGQPVAHGKAPKDHDRPGRIHDKCNAMLTQMGLGHEYLTDVVEVRPNADMSEAEARSALYALLESVNAVDVTRDDVDGTIHWDAPGRPSLVLFDAVPGGAGNADRIGERLADLAIAARERVAVCECGEETSCYSCLRSYGNQIWHDVLSRGSALRVLDEMIGGTAIRTPDSATGGAEIDLADESVQPLLRRIVEQGETDFSVGHEFDDGSVLEVAWPDLRVGVRLVDSGITREDWLIRRADEWTPEALWQALAERRLVAS